MPPLYGGIEAGGTKFVCAVGHGPDALLDEVRIPTTTPEETLARVVAFFRPYGAELCAVGIASFGPVDVRPGSPTYGFITTTPKPGWAHTPIVHIVAEALNVPVGFDTDVNGAALGEHLWGAGRGLDAFLYLTVGTGIGGGGLVNGKRLHGLLHPEMGHMRLPHDRERDPFPGLCPFHGDCLEGLASGPAIEARWGRPPHTLPPDHPAWALEAEYLGIALANLTFVFSPQRLVVGGGVMQPPHLWPQVRAAFVRALGNYVDLPALGQHVEDYLVPPHLGPRAGVLGAIALAVEAARGDTSTA
ncbi:MAG: ROK family protein [Ardenticatenia bacterium]|nr:ROK family protein [Ardenticatenia bacterium]